MEYVLIFSLILLAVECQGDLQVLPTAGAAQSSTTRVHRKKCIYDTVNGMAGADCSGMELQRIPNNLRSSIEIFDASYNRIRKIHKSDLSRYSYLKFLYLGDNMIMNIEPGSIEQLSYLEVLDLSLNGLQTIPSEIFEISTLRKLYLANNSFDFDPFKDLQIPIKARLSYINLSNSNLKSVPYFGSLPFLKHFNLAGNRFNKITVDDFLPHCSITNLDLSFIGLLDIDSCECFRLYEYFAWQKINVTMNNKICYHNVTASTQCTGSLEFGLNEIYQKCKGVSHTREARSTPTPAWLTIVLCMFGFLLLFVAVLFIMHRCNVASMKRNEEKPCDSKPLNR